MEYKIIFLGIGDESIERARQLAILSKLTRWPDNKIAPLLTSNKSAVIKTTANKQDASKIVKALATQGIKTTVKTSSSTNSSNDDSALLKQQVKSLQIEVAELRAQMNSLSEFVDEYVHKDFDEGEDIDNLLGIDEIDTSTMPKLEASVDELSIDPQPTLLSKLLPWIIAVGVVLIVALLAWQYLIVE